MVIKHLSYASATPPEQDSFRITVPPAKTNDITIDGPLPSDDVESGSPIIDTKKI